MRIRLRNATKSTLASMILFGSVGVGIADVGVDTTELRDAVTVEGIRVHQQAFQQFADDNGGTREASSEGYLESVKYVVGLMVDAGYIVSTQAFPYIFFEDVTDPLLQQLTPDDISYTAYEPEGFATATYSGSGDITSTVEPVDVVLPPGPEANTSNSGCEESDFDGFTEGNIALVQRGACSFFLKAFNAQTAGAAGVIIFNEGQEGRTDAIGATLGQQGVTIPVVFSSFDIGDALSSGEATARLLVDAVTEQRISLNVIADTPIGRTDRTLLVGAHLDSVAEGAGIQDNGSGSAGILEIALQLSETGLLDDEETGIRNRVRFAWWGAEELGLVGSFHYVDTIAERDLADIAVNLNFDMIGSPNYARFVYDGDGSNSETPGPLGSAFIEWLFNDYFAEEGLTVEPTAFDGRSDYGPFIEVGVPAGGLFTGAEGIKTEEQVALYGGTAGEQYDPCYHLACDNFDNVSLQALDEMSNAAAHAVMVFARNQLPETEIRARSRWNSAVDVAELPYRGSKLQR